VSALTLRPEPAHARENRRSRLSDRARQRALCQAWIAAAAAILVLAAVHQRMTDKYGSRGERYVQIEIGHAAQNIYIQALAWGLGTTEVGAFDDRAVRPCLASPATRLRLRSCQSAGSDDCL
jgi:SagB-type dehydrogenase family enzyme